LRRLDSAGEIWDNMSVGFGEFEAETVTFQSRFCTLRAKKKAEEFTLWFRESYKGALSFSESPNPFRSV
jgi:hypothetical protein